MRSLIVLVTGVLLTAPSARADTPANSAILLSSRSADATWSGAWPSCGDESTVAASVRHLTLPPIALQHDDAQSVHDDAPASQGDPQPAQPLHAAAVEHSDAYLKRAKIHKYASFATLPLFAAEVALGTSLYNTPANPDSQRTAHAIIGAGIIGLFGVNTVTGAWNMFGEGRRDTEGRTYRLVHGLLMMAADVGFLATWAAGPNSGSPREALTFESDKATHRNLAIASISVGTAGYLMMLFGNH
ncbi:MAG TPA: hypothetical protein VG222_14870 [Vicinamibacterales bacterium]|jgi:hypothetical protein|nr:hypothetical protein [Vicinamibacterales bacterium]